jgi:hypothetical protein
MRCMPTMTKSKTLSILFLASALAFVGCKKKEDAAASGSAAMGSAKPADTATTPAAATPPATPPPAASSGGKVTFASDDDFIAKQGAAMDGVIVIFQKAGTDCDKLAADISKFSDDNRATIVAGEEYVKTHPDVKAKFEAASKDKMPAFEAASNTAMTACKDNKKVADAMTKLTAE